MARIAIAYHSGYGHTEVLANSIADGVRQAGAEAVLLKIESPSQDFDPLLDEIGRSDAVIFGSPTYMGDVSGPFKMFADATSKAWFTEAWKDKLAAGFTVSHSFSGDKLHTLQSLSVLAAQHGMVWIGQGEAAPAVTAAERGPDSVNRVGAFLGLAAQADNLAPDVSPPAGEHLTARLLGERVGKAALRWARGVENDLAQAA